MIFPKYTYILERILLLFFVKSSLGSSGEASSKKVIHVRKSIFIFFSICNLGNSCTGLEIVGKLQKVWEKKFFDVLPIAY